MRRAPGIADRASYLALQRMTAGRGVEAWIMRDGKIAVWEAAFNFNEKGKPSAMGLT